MIRVLGTTKRACDGLTRREVLRVGTLSLFGVTLADALRAEAKLASCPGKARSVILLYLLDQVYSTLCEDLEARGLLDETLVVVMGEMGRSPKVNARGGPDHWSYLYNVLLTGAGVKHGLVFGASDYKGYRPTEHPVSPGDIIATIYEAMGIDTNSFIEDAGGRPRPIVPGGEAIRALLA